MIRRCFIALALLLAGCVSSPISLSENKIIPSKEAIVFGRVRVTSEGEAVTWPWYSQGFRIFVLPDITSEAVDYILTDDGSFYWHLLPGNYAIAGFKWGNGANYREGRIFAQFRIPEERAIIYIGTLTITFDARRYSLRIQDDSDQAVHGFMTNFPELRGKIVKSLMELEKPR